MCFMINRLRAAVRAIEVTPNVTSRPAGKQCHNPTLNADRPGAKVQEP